MSDDPVSAEAVSVPQAPSPAGSAGEPARVGPPLGGLAGRVSRAWGSRWWWRRWRSFVIDPFASRRKPAGGVADNASAISLST